MDGGLHAVNVNDQLRLAASAGNLDDIQDCLEAGAIFDADSDGRSALHYAALNGYTEVTRFLLEKGCQINAQDASGYTPLHRAASQGHIDVITVLLEAGCDVNTQDEHGNAAIHEAAWNGFSKTLELLVKHDVNVVLTNKAGFTALHLSAQNGHNESSRILLYAMCDSDIKNNYGDTALHTAARYGHAGVTRILISARSKLNEQNKNGDTALHIAAALKRRKIAKLLVESGIDVMMKNKQNETTVDVARRKEHTEIIDIVQAHRKSHIPGKMVNFKEDIHVMEGPVVVPDQDVPLPEKQETKPDKGKRFFFFKKKKAKEKGPVNGGVVSQKSVPPGSHVHVGQSPVQGFFSQYVPRDGIQYYRDLAGNIKKGPVGYTPTCNCTPALNQLEKQVHDTRDTVYNHLNTHNRAMQERIDQVDHKASLRVHALEQYTRDRFQEEEHLCRQRNSQRYHDESDYYNPQSDNVKIQIQSWLEQKLEGYGHCLHHHHDDSALPNENIFSDVHETGNGRLFRSRSDETLSQSDHHSGKGYRKREFYESRQEAMQQIRAWQVPSYSKDRNKIKILEKQFEHDQNRQQRSQSRQQLQSQQDVRRYPMEPKIEVRNNKASRDSNRVPPHHRSEADHMADDSTYVKMNNYGRLGAITKPSHIPQSNSNPQFHPPPKGTQGPVTHSTPKSRESSPYDTYDTGMVRSRTDSRLSGNMSEIPRSNTDTRLSRNVHNSVYKSDVTSSVPRNVQSPVNSANTRGVRQLFSPDRDHDSGLMYNLTDQSERVYNITGQSERLNHSSGQSEQVYNSSGQSERVYNITGQSEHLTHSSGQPERMYNLTGQSEHLTHSSGQSEQALNSQVQSEHVYNSPRQNEHVYNTQDPSNQLVSSSSIIQSAPLRNSTSSDKFTSALPKPTFTTFGYDDSMDGHTAPANSPEQRQNGEIPTSSTPRSTTSHSSHDEKPMKSSIFGSHAKQSHSSRNEKLSGDLNLDTSEFRIPSEPNKFGSHGRQNSQVSTGFVPTAKDDNYMDMSYATRTSTLNKRSRSSEGLLDDIYGQSNDTRTQSENRGIYHAYSNSQQGLPPVRSQSETRSSLQQSYRNSTPSRPLPQPQVPSSASRTVTHPMYSSTPQHSKQTSYSRSTERPPVAPKPSYNGYSSVRDVRYSGNQTNDIVTRNENTYSTVQDVKYQKDINHNVPSTKTNSSNMYYGQTTSTNNIHQLEPRSKSAYSTYLTGDSQYSRENSPNICNNSKEDSSSNPDSGYSSKIYGNPGATPVSATSTPSSSFSTDRGISLPSNTNSPQSQYSNADYEGLPQTEYQDEIQNHIQSWYQRKIQETTQKVYDNWRHENSPGKPRQNTTMQRYSAGNGGVDNYAHISYKDTRQGISNVPHNSYNGGMNYNNTQQGQRLHPSSSYLVHSSDV